MLERSVQPSGRSLHSQVQPRTHHAGHHHHAAPVRGGRGDGFERSSSGLAYGAKDADYGRPDGNGPVRQLQRQLAEGGFFTCDATGGYFEETRAAVRRFQLDRQLPVTGRADEATLTALNGGAAPASRPAAAPALQGSYLATAYYPCNNKMEGGFFTKRGNRIHTLEQAREDGKPVTAAVDPRLIPLGTTFTLKEFPGMTFLADDIGGAIKGRHIDIAMANRQQADDWGRRQVSGGELA